MRLFPNRLKFLITTAAVALALLGAVQMPGCSVGQTARQEVLLPIAKQAWFTGGVEADISRGLQDAVDDGDITPDQFSAWSGVVAGISQNLADNDRFIASMALIANWPDLRPFAERGVQDMVDDGELSSADFNGDGTPDMVESYHERLDRFEEAANILNQERN